MQSTRSIKAKTTFFVGSTINNATYLRPSDCTGTHGTRLKSNVECAVGQIFSTQSIGRRRNGLHFGVCCYVVQRFS